MKIQQAILGRLAFALLAGAAGVASAQTTGLVATPNPVNISTRGGELAYQYVTIKNYGPGFASNLAVSLSGGRHTSGLSIGSDTCTGARLAQGGFCSVQLVFDAACYVRAGSTDTWQFGVSSTELPGAYTQVNGTVLTRECI